MARTAVPYTNLPGNGAIAQPAGTALDATNGHTIVSADAERTLLRVTNSAGSDKVLTLKAGQYPPALASGLGDLAVTVAATSGVQLIGPFESGRFLQNDGSLSIDLASGFTGTITALRLPKAV